MGGDPDRVGGLWVRRPDSSLLPGQTGTLDTDIAEGLLGVSWMWPPGSRAGPAPPGQEGPGRRGRGSPRDPEAVAGTRRIRMRAVAPHSWSLSNQQSGHDL